MEEQEREADTGQAEPELLYHYTTLDGLLGILKDEVLWATGLRYLNDTSEFKAGTDALFHLMNAELSQAADFDPSADLLSKLFAADFDDAKVTTVVGTYTPLIRQSAVSVYTASFSAERTGDDLSQWRAYGGQNSGVSLGFRPPYLREISRQFLSDGKSPGWTGVDRDPLVKCGYYRDSAFPDIDPEVLGNVREIVALKPIPAKEASFTRYAASLKHEKFRAEEEWRILLTWGGDSIPGAAKFRRVRSLIVPYVCIPLRLNGQPIEMNRIVVGPTPHQFDATRSIEMLLKAHKVKFEKVVETKVPYRNW
jgi:hypothetical protein